MGLVEEWDSIGAIKHSISYLDTFWISNGIGTCFFPRSWWVSHRGWYCDNHHLSRLSGSRHSGLRWQHARVKIPFIFPNNNTIYTKCNIQIWLHKTSYPRDPVARLSHLTSTSSRTSGACCRIRSREVAVLQHYNWWSLFKRCTDNTTCELYKLYTTSCWYITAEIELLCHYSEIS